MELKNDHENQKSFSILNGDESCISRILAREASKGQSSRIFYRSAQGVPFKWETNPGTPKNPQQEGEIFPLSPSPLMQSFGLPLPNVDADHDHETKGSGLKMAIVSSLKKIVKKNIIRDISKKVDDAVDSRKSSKKRESSTFGDSNGEFVGSVKGSSFSSNSSFSMFSLNGCVVDTSTVDGPFCCNPLDVHAILDEGNTKIYYCRHHKRAFAVEQDNSFLSNVSALDNEQTPPGISKHPSENKLKIPPHNPPPAVQSLALPRPYMQHNSVCGSSMEFEGSLRRSTSVSSLKMGRKVYGSYLISCNPWRRRDVLAVAKRKLKSLIS